MAYKRRVYLTAKETLDNRRADAQRLQQQRRAEAAQICPAILDAEREMAACGAELIKIACAGGDTQEQLAALSQRNLDAQQRRADLHKQLDRRPQRVDIVQHAEHNDHQNALIRGPDYRHTRTFNILPLRIKERRYDKSRREQNNSRYQDTDRGL